MKKLTSFLCLFLTVLLLTACGQTPGNTAPVRKDPQQMLIDASRSYFQYDIKPIEVSHGEDYVIEWVDAGMEEHIRFLLDKPKGDILHSDVWDVQILRFAPDKGTPHDVMLTHPVEGWDTFFSDTIEFVEYKEAVWHAYGFREFPDVQSLADLRHFDSLQLLSLSGTPETPVDPAGLEHCVHLKTLEVYHTSEQILDIAAGLTELEQLLFSCSGSVDLSALQGHPTVRTLYLGGQELDSLEPLAAMPNLRALSLEEATFPSLEPLTETNLEALDITVSEGARGMYSELDYEPLSRIESMVCLKLTNHTAFDPEACTAVLEGCPNLKYLDIKYTPAANAIADGTWEPDLSGLEAYMAIPD